MDSFRFIWFIRTPHSEATILCDQGSKSLSSLKSKNLVEIANGTGLPITYKYATHKISAVDIELSTSGPNLSTFTMLTKLTDEIVLADLVKCSNDIIGWPASSSNAANAVRQIHCERCQGRFFLNKYGLLFLIESKTKLDYRFLYYVEQLLSSLETRLYFAVLASFGPVTDAEVIRSSLDKPFLEKVNSIITSELSQVARLVKLPIMNIAPRISSETAVIAHLSDLLEDFLRSAESKEKNYFPSSLFSVLLNTVVNKIDRSKRGDLMLTFSGLEKHNWLLLGKQTRSTLLVALLFVHVIAKLFPNGQCRRLFASDPNLGLCCPMSLTPVTSQNDVPFKTAVTTSVHSIKRGLTKTSSICTANFLDWSVTRSDIALGKEGENSADIFINNMVYSNNWLTAVFDRFTLCRSVETPKSVCVDYLANHVVLHACKKKAMTAHQSRVPPNLASTRHLAAALAVA